MEGRWEFLSLDVISKLRQVLHYSFDVIFLHPTLIKNSNQIYFLEAFQRPGQVSKFCDKLWQIARNKKWRFQRQTNPLERSNCYFTFFHLNIRNEESRKVDSNSLVWKFWQNSDSSMWNIGRKSWQSKESFQFGSLCFFLSVLFFYFIFSSPPDIKASREV